MKKYINKINELKRLKSNSIQRKNTIAVNLWQMEAGSNLPWIKNMVSDMDKVINGGSYQNMIDAVDYAVNVLNTIEEEE